ncbi:MAG: hypothetical protein COC15_01560 [Legionellales bacterium]|nr:MAG: hypothetical protein COC15_01560 [Legionellales bacterium]
MRLGNYLTRTEHILDVIKIADGVDNLATQIGAHRVTVYAWARDEKTPSYTYTLAMEIASNLLVTRFMMCPDAKKFDSHEPAPVIGQLPTKLLFENSSSDIYQNPNGISFSVAKNKGLLVDDNWRSMNWVNLDEIEKNSHIPVTRLMFGDLLRNDKNTIEFVRDSECFDIVSIIRALNIHLKTQQGKSNNFQYGDIAFDLVLDRRVIEFVEKTLQCFDIVSYRQALEVLYRGNAPLMHMVNCGAIHISKAASLIHQSDDAIYATIRQSIPLPLLLKGITPQRVDAYTSSINIIYQDGKDQQCLKSYTREFRINFVQNDNNLFTYRNIGGRWNA